MNPEDIIRLLEELATRLTPAAQHVFELAARQVVIDGIWNLLIFVGLVASTAIGGIATRALGRRLDADLVARMEQYEKDLKEYQERRSKDSYYSSLFSPSKPRQGYDFLFVVWLFFLMPLLVTIILGSMFLKRGIDLVLNPEYWTLIKLSELIR